ncbi:ArsR/SmtB family transcription factor [Marinibaculum pumilum]|uniref:ArsR/SmtB family transcription factor n=1 Tax=Marinibaculum pumilum TaxID=1766165 RepID=A0ABV7KZT7_9PROT
MTKAERQGLERHGEAPPGGAAPDGDRLLAALEALANPHRLRILGLLHRQGRAYVSQLARDLNMGRPLLHMHLKRLERAGLVESRMEIAPDGKTLNWFATTAFDFRISPQSLAEAAGGLTAPLPTSRPAPSK